MAGSKEIRNKIKSVQSTRKITKAMEMVAASKMKKAQDRMRASRPYVDRALQIAMHVAKANTEYKHPFLVKREAVRRVGAIVALALATVALAPTASAHSPRPAAGAPARGIAAPAGAAAGCRAIAEIDGLRRGPDPGCIPGTVRRTPCRRPER